MPTFTFDLTLAEWRDYARWRLDDTDENDVLIYDETYDALYERFGEVNGLVHAAGQIAIQISKRVTAFGEAAGIRFTKGNLDYYQQLPHIIAGEPPFSTFSSPGRLARLGKLKAGVVMANSVYDISNLLLKVP